jgi:uncharacterized SAM-binding protein YcdF (DUF218 family)
MRKTYIVGSRAWYWSALSQAKNPSDARIVDDISVQLGGSVRDGVNYEFMIRWHRFQIDRPLSAEISFFEDSWMAFKDFPDLFAELAQQHKKNPSVATIEKILKSHGFKDITPTQKPKELTRDKPSFKLLT